MTFSLTLLFASFLAGVLTILAPCVLPLLPVIVGGAAGTRNKWYPLILVSSLATSIVLFTVILRLSTRLFFIPDSVWTSISGGIVLLFGFAWLFPKIWELVVGKLHLLEKSQKNLSKASQIESNWGAVAMGAALGPVFASCSPIYFFIVALMIEGDIASGMIYLITYAIGLTIMLGLIAFFGQRITTKLGWAADPNGWLKRGIGLLLIIVGVAVMTGLDKRLESKLLDWGLMGTETQFELNLLDEIRNDMEEETQEKIEIPADITGLPTLGDAPELTELENWINSDPILSMEELEGKVVLINFWNYSCLECARTLPYLQSWHEEYNEDGLVIIGVHVPQFKFERDLTNLAAAVSNSDINYAVAQDNDKQLWSAYNNEHWNTKYLIDKEGKVRYQHMGEGGYEVIENNITKLLQTKVETSSVDADIVDFEKIETGKTNIGMDRRSNFVSDPGAALAKNQWTLTGFWEEGPESALSVDFENGVRMNFTASKANLVISGEGVAIVTVDGENANGADVVDGILTLDGPRLYELVDFEGEYDTHEIQIIFDQPGVEIFEWSFG